MTDEHSYWLAEIERWAEKYKTDPPTWTRGETDRSYIIGTMYNIDDRGRLDLEQELENYRREKEVGMKDVEIYIHNVSTTTAKKIHQLIADLNINYNITVSSSEDDAERIREARKYISDDMDQVDSLIEWANEGVDLNNPNALRVSWRMFKGSKVLVYGTRHFDFDAVLRVGDFILKDNRGLIQFIAQNRESVQALNSDIMKTLVAGGEEV